MKTKARTLRCLAGVMCLLGMVICTRADPIDFFDDATPRRERALPRSDFFALETVNLFGEQRDSRQEERSRQAIQLAPNWMEPYSDMRRRRMAIEHARNAEEAMLEGQVQRALREINQALLRDPENVLIKGQAALIYAAAHKYHEASRYFRVYLQHHPDHVRFIGAWGGVLMRIGDLPTAREMISRAVALNPEDPMTRYHAEILGVLEGKTRPEWDRWPILEMAQARGMIGAILEEEKDLRELLGPEGFSRLCQFVVGPDSIEKLRQIVVLFDEYARSLQREEAAEVIRIGLELTGLGWHNQWIVMNIAQMCYQEGEVERAWEMLVKLQNKHPEFLPAWSNGGLMALNLERWQSAEYMYKRVLRFGYSGEAFFALACAYAGQGRYDEAWRILKDLRDTQPERLNGWLAGESTYVRNVRNMPRFYELGVRL